MKLLVCCMAVVQTSCATLFSHGASRWTGALRVRGGADAEAPAEPKMYPGLSIKEIIEVLDKVPLFGVTDLAGSSVVMQTRDPTSATPDATTGQSIFFFTHADMAKAVLTTLDSSRDQSAAALSGAEIPKLKVSERRAVGTVGAVGAGVRLRECGRSSLEARLKLESNSRPSSSRG